MRLAPALMIGTMIAGMPAVAARKAPAPKPAAAEAAPAPVVSTPAVQPGSGTIRSIAVSGNQRLEADTVRSYIKLKPGDHYTRELLDQALKDLYASELFADVTIAGADTGDIVLRVRENPVINRIVLEGNKRIKEEKIRPEIKLAPRQIFTRSKARADVARIIELYRRQGRYAATVEPKMVLLDQNRVDIVFEIHEGAKSRVQAINIIGNHKFKASRLRAEMATKTSGITHIFSGGTSYDPDRLAYDQQKLRQFYLTNGYADFHVVSAVAELTPDKRDFIITYVVDEGKRYHFGDVHIESDIRDLKSKDLEYLLKIKKGDWYNAKTVEDTVDSLTETAGLLGYAFADVRPNFERDKDALTMSVTFRIANAPRVYVERVDINGNTVTRDKVIRRELRLAEGDAFNGFRVKRSRDRIQSLGYFQQKFEIEQKQGSAPDRVVLEANVEEKSTGQLQVSAGYSSLEKFIVSLSITQSNFMGKGQEVRASTDYSIYSKSVSVGFTEPYLFDHNIAVGGDVFRRDYNSFNYVDTNRNTTYDQVSTGFQIRAGVPLTEFWSLALRYGLTQDKVSLNQSTFYSAYLPDGTLDPTGTLRCDPLLAGRYLCDAIGNRTTSSVGYSVVFDNLNDRIHPTRGQRAIFSQDVAGLGGSVRYVRTRVEGHKYWGLWGFTLSANAEGGYIRSLEGDKGPGVDKVRLTDRFYLGGQQQPDFAGFDIRGIGPRVLRRSCLTTSTTVCEPDPDRKNAVDDALGGRYYYFGRLEMLLPLGNGAKELGIRPSIFANIGSVWGLTTPNLQSVGVGGQFREILNSDGTRLCYDSAGTLPSQSVKQNTTCPSGLTPYGTTISGFQEQYLGDTWRPRVSVGIGVNWNSPFGPFRIDIAKALVKYPGDAPKLFSFNVGTQF
ncbi:outer membrane protein assembly factor BamA [Sphingomonas nostoxanthinifaciens]|uniref:outer membrane protein assembly factor BamA n=1 Tax=Sphingomonas nostoxanthinifaciens TaxID=2872652 RepID=UPI001CC2171C|nr:outer membrane protein assembly factor BamA [Sphingomonas nostoxanthinifaciens]UAK26488.1 outer membrane protein assembly factor BamA [Sphingomonas nostoxanthinifaciens]